MMEAIQKLPDPAKLHELAAALRVSTLSVRQAIRRGDLMAYHTTIRGDLRIPRSAVVAWLERVSSVAE